MRWLRKKKKLLMFDVQTTIATDAFSLRPGRENDYQKLSGIKLAATGRLNDDLIYFNPETDFVKRSPLILPRVAMERLVV